MTDRTDAHAAPQGGPDSTPHQTSAATRSRPWAMWLLAMLALGYLVAMVVTGALPRQQQLIEFEARGVMREAPESARRVEVTSDGVQRVFIRDAIDVWTLEGGGTIEAEASRRLSLAVQFLNTSAPLRHLAQQELVGMTPADFGLDPPRVATRVSGAQGSSIAVNFGAENPDATAQYMSVDGRDGVYLISRFVGNEWFAVTQIGAAQ